MYALTYDRRIEKDLRQLPKPQRELILSKLERLAVEPRHAQVEKLEGMDGYRLRVSDYRILFTIDDHYRLVTIHRIRHRREAYR